MKLNVLTVVTTSNKMEGSSDDPEAQASEGAGTEAVVNTKQVQLVGKLPLISTGWKTAINQHQPGPLEPFQYGPS